MGGAGSWVFNFNVGAAAAFMFERRWALRRCIGRFICNEWCILRQNISARGFVRHVYSAIHMMCRGRCFVKFNFGNISICSFKAMFG